MLDNNAYLSPTPATGKAHSAERVLRSAVVHGVLRPGQRLSEASLCSEFALGRGAVRAALAQLQASGFVSASARSGWSVAGISATEIREVVTGRRQLEPLLAGIATTEMERTQLRRLSDMYLALTSRSDQTSDLLPTLRLYERDILDILASRLGLPRIAGWLADLWDRSTRLILFFEGQGCVHLAAADRAGFARAVIDGDQAKARALLAAAIDDLEGYLTARFLESGATLAALSGAETHQKKKRHSKQTHEARNTGRIRTL